MAAGIPSCVCVIPNDQMNNVVDLALETIHMDKERAQGKFADAYESTKERCYSTFECKGMYASFPVESREGDEIRLENGTVLKSQMLTDVLKRAEVVVFYAVCAHGYEAVAANPENSMIETMFYDAWGSGFSMAAHRWLKRVIADAARDSGLYASRGWVPGEEGLEMNLQKELFECLDPSQIGLTVNDQFTMRPIMSVSGIMGLSSDQAIETDGSEYIEQH